MNQAVNYTPRTTKIQPPSSLTGNTLTSFARALYGNDEIKVVYDRKDKEWLIMGDGIEAESIGTNKGEARAYLMDVLTTMDVTEDELDAAPQPKKEIKKMPDYKQLRISGQSLDIVPTADMQAALHMVQNTMQRPFNRVASITGSPGTGKTVASHYIADSLGGNRLCAYKGMTKKDMLVQLAGECGHPNPQSCNYGYLMGWLGAKVDGALFLIDEANHLGWQHLEALRYLADESGATVILFGTELLKQNFSDRKTKVLLAQLSSRIGAKNVEFKPIPNSGDGLKRISAYFVEPNFGKCNKASILRAFYKASQGYWRLGRELVEAIKLLMEQQGFSEITKDVVEAAASYLSAN